MNDDSLTPNSTVSLHTGNAMPIMGFGTWQCTYETASTVEAILKLGYRLIDTSGDYGTQPGISEGIRRSGIERDKLYLVTKVEETDNAYEATTQNLKELDISYADLVLIHRPPTRGVGEALWRGLIKAREGGLTKDIGVSNYSKAQIEELIALTGVVPVVNQIEWSPFGYSEGMQRYTNEKDMRIQAYSPLTRTKCLEDEDLQEVAKRHMKTPAQVLIRWNLQVGTVPIPKANQIEHAEENLDVFDFKLLKEDMEQLNALNRRYSVFGTLPYT